MRLIMSFVLIAFAPAVAVAQSPTRCLGPTVESAQLIRELRRLMTTADPGEAYARQYVYKLPVVDTTRVILVTKAATCAKASAAYGPPPGGAENPNVYVVQLAQKGFAVMDPLQLAAGHKIVIIYNKRWVAIGGWTGG